MSVFTDIQIYFEREISMLFADLPLQGEFHPLHAVIAFAVIALALSPYWVPLLWNAIKKKWLQ